MKVRDLVGLDATLQRADERDGSAAILSPTLGGFTAIIAPPVQAVGVASALVLPPHAAERLAPPASFDTLGFAFVDESGLHVTTRDGVFTLALRE